MDVFNWIFCCAHFLCLDDFYDMQKQCNEDLNTSEFTKYYTNFHNDHAEPVCSFANSQIPKERDFGKAVNNARRILDELERSIKISARCEELLSATSATHAHFASEDSGYHTDPVSKVSVLTESESPTVNTTRAELRPAEAWATMSIVCLQYQYDELTRAYQKLLKVHDERCKDVSTRDLALADCRVESRAAWQEISDAQYTVHNICCKYLALKKRKDRDKLKYEEKIRALEDTTSHLLNLLHQSQMEVDVLLQNQMMEEREPTRALLLSEENLRLKAQVEKLTEISTKWKVH